MICMGSRLVAAAAAAIMVVKVCGSLATRDRSLPFQIKAASDPTECMDVRRGQPHNGNDIIIHTCGADNENQHFLLPDGEGQIQWATDSSKCLTVSRAGSIELWDCGSRNRNQDYVVNPASGYGRISFGRNSARCMSFARRLLLSSRVRTSRCGSWLGSDEFVFSPLAAPVPTEAPTAAPTETPPPPSIAVAGSVEYPFGYAEAAVSGDIVFVTSGGGVEIIGWYYATHPVNLGRLPESYCEGASGLSITEDTLVVASMYEHSLSVVDVSDKTALRLLGSVTDSENLSRPVKVVADGNYSYLCHTTCQEEYVFLTVLDISNTSSLQAIGSVSLGEWSDSDYDCGLALDGDFAFLALGWDGAFVVVDVHDKRDPQLVGSLNLREDRSYPIDVVVSGNHAYVADYNSAELLKVIDVSRKNDPKLVGSLQDSRGATSIAIKSSYLFVGVRSALLVVDVSDPTLPTIVESWQTSTDDPRRIDEVQLSGVYALAFAYTGSGRNTMFVLSTLPSGG
mmetsp:Transcript_33259/g.91671  ORF Transcript_33259/g.91671 Transcript_33259/m.91671 type:complete len:510 (-) Transcript_33259:174-1703(-)